MKTTWKRIASWLMALTMIAGCLYIPVPAQASVDQTATDVTGQAAPSRDEGSDGEEILIQDELTAPSDESGDAVLEDEGILSGENEEGLPAEEKPSQDMPMEEGPVQDIPENGGPALATEVEAITVSLTVSTVESVMAVPVEIQVPYSAYSELGLAGITNNDPGHITPLHVLAAYYMQKKGATKETMANYITTDADGAVTTLEGKNGTDANGENGKWRIAVNDKLPATVEGEVTTPNTTGDAPLKDGDDLMVFGIQEDVAQYYSGFTSRKTASKTLALRGQELDVGPVQLVKLDKYNYKIGWMQELKDILKDMEAGLFTRSEDNKLEPVAQDLYAISYTPGGNVKVTVNAPAGDYYLQAKAPSGSAVYNTCVMKIDVDDDPDHYAVSKYMKGLSFRLAGKSMGTVTGTNIGFSWPANDSGIDLEITTSDPERAQFAQSTTMLSVETDNSGLTEAYPVKVTFTAKKGETTEEKTFDIMLLPSVDLSALKIKGVEDFPFDSKEKSYSFVKTEGKKEIEIAAEFLCKDNKDLKLYINDELVEDPSVPYKYTLNDPEESFVEKIQVKAAWEDIPDLWSGSTLSSIYTLTFNKEATARPSYDSIWPMARQDVWNRAAANVPSPRNADEIDQEKSWAVETGGNIFYPDSDRIQKWGKWSYPLVVDNHIYMAVACNGRYTIQKYNMDGNKAAEAATNGGVLGAGYTGWLAYGEGMIFVPSGQNIFALNADDLTPLWRGNSGITSGYQSSCPVIYKDGYIYSGTTMGSRGGGGYYCFDVRDDDPNNSDETKKPVWCMEAEKNPLTDDASFYWAGAAIIGNYLVVPCDDGNLYSIDLEASKNAEGGTPTFAQTLSVSGDGAKQNLRNSLVYDEERGQIYFNTAECLMVIKFDGNTGKFGEMTKVEGVKAAANTTVAYAYGRIYDVTRDGIAVVNADTLETIYVAGPCKSADGEEVLPSSLSISTAYATKKSGYTVYLYGNSNTNPNSQVVMKDSQTTTEGQVELLSTVTVRPQYCTSQIFFGEDGSLIFVNDSSNLYCLRSKVSKEDVLPDQIIDRIDQIQEVALEDKETIERLEADYASLSEEAKQKIENYEKLAQARKDLDRLLAEEAFAKASPKGVKAQALDYNTVKLTWSRMADAEGYRIYCKEKGKERKLVARISKGTTTSYTHKNLKTGTSYTYYVRAYWGKVQSVLPKGASARPQLGTVKAKKATPKKRTAVITWNKVKGASGYRIYCKTSKKGKWKSVKQIKGGSKVSYTHKKLKKDRTYYYKICAYRTVGGKKVSGGYSAVKKAKIK